MSIIKKTIKSLLFWLIIVEAILVVVLFLCGYRITYAPALEPNWDSVGAIGQWVGALVGLLIPIAAVYVQHELGKNKIEIKAELDRNKSDIGESNADLYNELIKYAEKLKILTKLVDENGNIVIDGGNFIEEEPIDVLKDKALKFVNISFVTNTQRVAEHLNVSNEKAYGILKEMALHDGSISFAGQLNEKNMLDTPWLKKRKL